jgi:bifunctional non-homologous end joining protein LigD
MPDKLQEYRRKRSFDKTPEPAGKVQPRRGISRFVVQKHRASRLHYDLRLEIGGVLVSWAVPRGPSLNPTDRRLAVHVEDHPIEYFDFEGTIPKGEYGGGTVMVWDWGGVRWLGDDPEAMMARHDLKFELFGRKLRGAYAIVGGRGEDNAWFLIKKRDHGASEADVAEQDHSVLSGRSMDDIAAAGSRVWHSDRPAAEQGMGAAGFADLKNAKKASFPVTIEPMLAHPETKPFNDPDWTFELKLDGFRTLALVRNGKVRLLSRRGGDASKQFPELQDLGVLVRSKEAVLDGEVVALDEEGLPSFGLLQERTGWKGGRTGREPHPTIPILYYVFDMLYDDGYSLLGVPLRERRRLMMARLLDGPAVRLLETFDGSVGVLLFDAAKAQGQEGVVAKKLSSIYTPGKRSRSWLKIKANREQSCVVVGFTPPQGGREHFGSLALAVLDGGKLSYAGQVGSGFDGRMLDQLMKSLKPLVMETPPKSLARKDLAPKEITWVRPELFCDVKFNEWTREKILRQPTFLRMRTDLAIDDCRREQA